MSNIDKQSYFDGKRFHNYDSSSKNKSNFFKFLKWRKNRNDEIKEWPEWIINKDYDYPAKFVNDGIVATFINHSTILIQTAGLNIITDPVWSKRVSPFSFIGPKRVRDPGISIDNLPPIDIILISHDHYDHLDITTLKILDKKFKPKIVSGKNINSILKKHDLSCMELDWWEKADLFDLEIYFLPAKHWSGRKGFFGNNYTLWGSFLVKSKNHKIYFAGDTAYSNHIKDIRQKFGEIDLSLIPIGAYEPRWFMKESHTNPYEAALIHKELDSKNSIAIHHSTFRLSDESYDDPIDDLDRAIEELNIKNFKILDFGESIEIPIDDKSMS
jgi:L-ascorbate metabolism protein UlaG (beta-lactamase superfamily)